MVTELDKMFLGNSEMDFCPQLTRLVAQEDFIKAYIFMKLRLYMHTHMLGRLTIKLEIRIVTISKLYSSIS
jgi:hypothetical protein